MLFRSALAIDPWRADAHHNLVLALVSESKIDEALVDVQEALRIRPDSPQALADLASLQQLMNGGGGGGERKGGRLHSRRCPGGSCR